MSNSPEDSFGLQQPWQPNPQLQQPGTRQPGIVGRNNMINRGDPPMHSHQRPQQGILSGQQPSSNPMDVSDPMDETGLAPSKMPPTMPEGLDSLIGQLGHLSLQRTAQPNLAQFGLNGASEIKGPLNMESPNPNPNPSQASNPPNPAHPNSVVDLFSPDFINTVASSLDEFDGTMFRPDGDINFERDFGHWFEGDDVMEIDSSSGRQTNISLSAPALPQANRVSSFNPSNPNPPNPTGNPSGPSQGFYAPNPTYLGPGVDLFSTDFINSVASSLDEFDGNMFRPDGDINFERDFRQWFNGDDGVWAIDSMK